MNEIQRRAQEQNLRILIDVCRRSSGDSMTYKLVRHIDELERKLATLETPQVLSASAKCPLCGHEGPHPHTPLEQVIYRNGIKVGRAQVSETVAP